MKFQVMLWNQWRWSRIALVLGTIAGFALPILSLQGASRTEAMRPLDLLVFLSGWSIFYPLLAGGLGLLLAIGAWAPDHRGRHVHALSLPVERWRYALLRFGSGVVLLIVPILALCLGALLATRGAAIPPGLRGYPLSLGLRFGLATMVAFAVFFAVSGGTARTAGIILSVIGGLVALQIFGSAVGIDISLGALVESGLLTWPGPLALFTGRWMLIDV